MAFCERSSCLAVEEIFCCNEMQYVSRLPQKMLISAYFKAHLSLLLTINSNRVILTCLPATEVTMTFQPTCFPIVHQMFSLPLYSVNLLK